MERAARGKYAIGAFNVSSLEVLKAIVNAAAKLRSPVIIETSSGETAYMGEAVQVAMLSIYQRQLGIPILSNLDHAKTYPDVRRAMDAGFSLLHFDGSELPESTNIRILKRIVREAHRHKLLVEGELDHITGSSEWHWRTKAETEQRQGRYTDPEKARAFVCATGIDTFAAFFGNVHGVFATPERLDFQRLAAIRSAVPCWLSLHGGSGIPGRDVRRAIAMGITKVNVNTELRMAYISSLRKVLRNRKEIAPYKLLPPVIAAVQKVVEEKIKIFGSAGKA